MSVDKIKFENTKDLASHTLKILVFAPPGRGKTYLARTTGAKTLVISAESGLLSLKGADIDVWDITKNSSGKVIEDPVGRLVRLQEIGDLLVKGTDHKWVFLDSVTEISEIVVAMLDKQFPDRKDSIVKWGEVLKTMAKIVRGFRDLPNYNVVFTALESVDKDENNRRFSSADVHGKTSKKLPGWFDEVFYIDVDEEAPENDPHAGRRLLTRGTKKMDLKDRSGNLAPVEIPNLAYIAEKILSSGKGTNGS